MKTTISGHDPAAALQAALAQHQRGALDAARRAYLAILERAPDNADALHLLGVVARQQNDAKLAVELIGRAIAINARQATMHCNLGAALQDLGEPARALASYDAALALTPAYALAWSNRGNSLRQLGRLEQACASYERALTLRADYPEALSNLAIVLHGLGRDAQALAAASRALALRPRDVAALCASGNALHGLQRYDEAVAQFSRALDCDASHAPAWCWRGIALQKLGRHADAIASYRQAIALRPSLADPFHFMGNALRACGEDAAALAAWRTALALGGNADVLGFAIAAATGAATAAGAPAAVPASAPESYVQTLFDDYADRFDAHLVGQLDYRTPGLIGAALATLGLPDGLDVLDLGCGTGLCAPVLRARARSLTGVDLAQKMLDKAHARGGYDLLACAEIGAWLDRQTAQFDLVVAADVLVYVGDLAPLLRRVHGALRPGGWMVASVESHAGAGFILQPTSRYAHAPAYVESAARAAGLRWHTASAAVLRRERGEAVHGQIVLLHKPPVP